MVGVAIYKTMSTLEEDIERAKRDLATYFRKRQKNLDDKKRFEYYHERCIIREERIIILTQRLKKKEGQDHDK